jgi:D-amino-acid dehydrogenase
MPGKAMVIGGGIVGSASALALQRGGFAVTLIDPMREASGASWGNAGHIAIEQVEPLASRAVLRSVPGRLFANGGALDFCLGDFDRWLPFSLRLLAASSPARFAKGKSALGSLLGRASDAWARLAADLGAPGLYREIGHAVMWESEKSAVAGIAQWKATDVGTAKFHIASAPELARIAALLKTKPAAAICFENSGQISDHGELAIALARTFEARGGTRLYQSARLGRTGDRAEVIVAGEKAIEADLILVAAGAKSADVLREEGTFAPLIAERGYHLRAPVAEQWPSDLGPVAFEDRSLIVGRFASAMRASSFVEFGRPDSAPDPKKWARLRQHITELGLPFALPAETWMGSRPTLPDYLPAIGRSRRSTNVIYAFGHQHLGLTMGPITGELIGQLATGTATAVPLEPFSLERFG